MFNKLNLMSEDRVEICNINADLNGRKGNVIGKAIEHIIDFYIVLLDEPIKQNAFIHKAVSIPESCLKRVN